MTAVKPQGYLLVSFLIGQNRQEVGGLNVSFWGHRVRIPDYIGSPYWPREVCARPLKSNELFIYFKEPASRPTAPNVVPSLSSCIGYMNQHLPLIATARHVNSMQMLHLPYAWTCMVALETWFQDRFICLVSPR
jgi:hypothetical protein